MNEVYFVKLIRSEPAMNVGDIVETYKYIKYWRSFGFNPELIIHQG